MVKKIYELTYPYKGLLAAKGYNIILRNSMVPGTVLYCTVRTVRTVQYSSATVVEWYSIVHTVQ